MRGPMSPPVGSSLRRRPSLAALLLSSWSILGVLLLLGQALFRLAPLAWEPLAHGQLTNVQLALYVGWILLNGYLEGYRGFQKRFVPRVLARAEHLGRHPTLLRGVFGPLFVMGFFHATKRALYSAWGITIAVALAILVVRSFAQPWRGIIDAGVVAGLGWGSVCLLVGWFQLLRGEPTELDPEIPDREPVEETDSNLIWEATSEG